MFMPAIVRNRNWTSLLIVLFMLVCLFLQTQAQSMERNLRAPQPKFIRFGRAGQRFIRFGRSSWDYDTEPGVSNVDDDNVPIILKRAGQRFIRFG
uniref:Uncharacterized protein n=1 Tax=Acrobeloides nanus TaxID=290746 RepID=A0A914D4R9_9BILA